MNTDIGCTKSKLEKGLKTLHFLDNNINNLSNWLNGVEQKLYEIENNHLPENNVDIQLQFIKVNISVTLLL